MTKLTGRVQIYGNVPHTYLGIVDEKGIEFAVYPPEQEEKLRGLQGHLIEFTVIFLYKPQGEGRQSYIPKSFPIKITFIRPAGYTCHRLPRAVKLLKSPLFP